MGRLMMYTESTHAGVCNTCGNDAGDDASGVIIAGLVPKLGDTGAQSSRNMRELCRM